jgi:hypothetical protein
VSDMSHDEREPERGPLDVEAAFADIVAHWDDPNRSPVGSWPAQEDIGPTLVDDGKDGRDGKGGAPGGATEATDLLAPGSPTATPPAPSTPAKPTSPAGPAVSGYDIPLAPADWTPPKVEPVEEESEGYVPPEPPPLLRGDPIGWLAWAAVLGGPLFLLLASQVWTDIGRIWIMLAVLAFIGGFAAIVARLPNSRNDDDPDDGAVV